MPPLSRQIPDMQALDALALTERMGAKEFAARVEMEQQMRERRGVGQGRGAFRFEHLWDMYGFIRLCLKVSGFWPRAHRNYFDIQVVRNEVVLERLPAAFDGFTILQLTDLHADLHPDFPAAVQRVIAPLQYDCMALTGDFRTCTFGDHSGAIRASIEILKDVSAPRFATLGNHDSLHKVPLLEAAGVQFLLNENAVLRRGADALYVVGIDDPNFYKSHNFDHALAGVPEEACKLLLSHSPQTYREAARRGLDFLMAGHTHGGQICLPGGRVLMHDHSAPRHVLSGVWREGRLQGYTSRGTGASALPVRLNCPAEVTLHVLRCGQKL
jgi:predicted MPP superfamily phosphohydrolase